MAGRYVAGASCAVGSATLPQGSLYSAAAVAANLLECAWFGNSTNTRKVYLTRLASAGTPGAAMAEAKYDDDADAAQCVASGTHTVAPTLGDRLHAYSVINLAQSGTQYGFHDYPMEIPVGTANGVGFLPVTAAGAADVVFVWDE